MRTFLFLAFLIILIPFSHAALTIGSDSIDGGVIELHDLTNQSGGGSSGGDINGSLYVPYSGAISNVNLNGKNLSNVGQLALGGAPFSQAGLSMRSTFWNSGIYIGGTQRMDGSSTLYNIISADNSLVLDSNMEEVYGLDVGTSVSGDGNITNQYAGVWFKPSMMSYSGTIHELTGYHMNGAIGSSTKIGKTSLASQDTTYLGRVDEYTGINIIPSFTNLGNSTGVNVGDMCVAGASPCYAIRTVSGTVSIGTDGADNSDVAFYGASAGYPMTWTAGTSTLFTPNLQVGTGSMFQLDTNGQLVADWDAGGYGITAGTLTADNFYHRLSDGVSGGRFITANGLIGNNLFNFNQYILPSDLSQIASNTQVLFRNATAVIGDSNLTFDSTRGILTAKTFSNGTANMTASKTITINPAYTLVGGMAVSGIISGGSTYYNQFGGDTTPSTVSASESFEMPHNATIRNLYVYMATGSNLAVNLTVNGVIRELGCKTPIKAQASCTDNVNTVSVVKGDNITTSIYFYNSTSVTAEIFSVEVVTPVTFIT